MIKPYFLLCCILISCASVQTLSGGDKDTAAPRIIKTSIDSGATSVSVSQFRFFFDENMSILENVAEFAHNSYFINFSYTWDPDSVTI